jgi:hypothetical protein
MSMPGNPYEPSQEVAKLATGDARDIKVRDPAVVVLLMLVTCGLYVIYLQYQWAKELNGLEGQVRYPPVITLVLNIVTLGLSGLVFESIWAYDLARAAQRRGVVNRMESLPTWVLVLNCVGTVLCLTGIGIVIGLPMGIAASVLVQNELNKLAATLPVLKGELA